MTPTDREAAAYLAAAHAKRGAPAPRLRSQAAPPAQTSPGVASPSAPGEGACPSEVDPGGLGLPLSDDLLARLGELEQLVGPERFGGWVREGHRGAFAVDVGPVRYHGETLLEAIEKALAAERATR
jgi:hypothetical protein